MQIVRVMDPGAAPWGLFAWPPLRWDGRSLWFPEFQCSIDVGPSRGEGLLAVVAMCREPVLVHEAHQRGE